MYIYIYIYIYIFNVIVTVGLVERIFLKLEIIKMYLRLIMFQQRLNILVLVLLKKKC